ncbi:MAG TPA: DUF5686 family protein, partial [Chitinophagaceae bacterium]|nr:DUF5686 family protein [Chitinophagaceae bacterium]
MPIKAYITILLLLFSSALLAQTHRVWGRITDSRMEPLSLVTIQVKDAPSSGRLSKADGSYELELSHGTYELVVTMIGYKSQVIPIVVQGDLQKNIILEEEEKNLEEVVIRTKVKDRAEEVMRNLIRHKEQVQAAPGAYSVLAYVKAVQQDSGTRRAKNDDETAMAAAGLNGMAMAEISLRLERSASGQIREERLGVRKSGSAHSLFYLSATEGDFDLYDNLLKVPAVSPTPFVSPVSYSGLVAYRFKTIKLQRTGKHRIYTISFRPRQLTNAAIEGELTVSDSTWTILHARYRFPSYHLQEYAFFEVEQEFAPVQDSIWMLSRQHFTYHISSGKARQSGQTIVRYSDYEVRRQFGRRHFSSELSATAQEAYTKDSTFWQTVRAEPLSAKELRFIRVQDSLATLRSSDRYLDSLERAINKITWKKVAFFGQSLYDRQKERTWHLPPLVSLYQPVA